MLLNICYCIWLIYANINLYRHIITPMHDKIISNLKPWLCPALQVDLFRFRKGKNHRHSGLRCTSHPLGTSGIRSGPLPRSLAGCISLLSVLRSVSSRCRTRLLPPRSSIHLRTPLTLSFMSNMSRHFHILRNSAIPLFAMIRALPTCCYFVGSLCWDFPWRSDFPQACWSSYIVHFFYGWH